MEVIKKLQRKWKKLRLRPIRIFCLHHVCKAYDEESMCIGDWMSISSFKAKIMNMQKVGVHFISMKEAQKHMTCDVVRCRNYAVITFDDGYSSLKEILPWLAEHNIPVTLFINGKYLDGKSYRDNSNEKYLTREELWTLASPFIEVGSHGWEHIDATQMSLDEFGRYIDENLKLIQQHPGYIPFHAYTWGRHTLGTDAYLHSKRITPVYIDGMKNYNGTEVVHRELL